MALEDDIRALERAPLLKGLGREALRLLAFSAEVRLLRAGDVLFRKGQPADAGFVVVSGTVALSSGDDGAPADRLVGAGTLLGELALIAEMERPATAVAREPSQVFRIPRTVFRRVLDEFPEIARRLHAEIAERLRAEAAELAAIHARLEALDRR